MSQQITIELDDEIYESLSQNIGQENLTSFFNHVAKRYVLANINSAPAPTNTFDKFFGILQSDKSVSLEDMDKAIANEGSRL